MAGAVSETAPLGAALFTAGAAATFRAAYFAAFLDFAQRAFCAAATFARASGLMVRRTKGFAADFAGMELVALPDKLTRDGRPGFRFIVISVPAKSAFAFPSRDINASISIRMSALFMDPPSFENTRVIIELASQYECSTVHFDQRESVIREHGFNVARSSPGLHGIALFFDRNCSLALAILLKSGIIPANLG